MLYGPMTVWSGVRGDIDWRVLMDSGGELVVRGQRGQEKKAEAYGSGPGSLGVADDATGKPSNSKAMLRSTQQQ